MQSFELQNEIVCKRHSGMFKHDKYTFHPQKDLVLSMPYEFVANLEPGKFTSLDKLWLKNVRKILKKAKKNSIKQIRLVATTNFILPGQLFKDFTCNKSFSCPSACMQ